MFCFGRCIVGPVVVRFELYNKHKVGPIGVICIRCGYALVGCGSASVVGSWVVIWAGLLLFGTALSADFCVSRIGLMWVEFFFCFMFGYLVCSAGIIGVILLPKLISLVDGA